MENTVIYKHETYGKAVYYIHALKIPNKQSEKISFPRYDANKLTFHLWDDIATEKKMSLSREKTRKF